jgi:hypothetical protein
MLFRRPIGNEQKLKAHECRVLVAPSVLHQRQEKAPFVDLIGGATLVTA